MKNFIDIICKTSVFCGIDKAECEKLINCLGASVKEYAKGSYILLAGEQIHSMGLMLNGSAVVVQEDFWGNQNLMTHITAGNIFAESFACVYGAVTNVSVLADKNCEVLWLDVHKILDVCENKCGCHTRLVHNMLSETAAKNLRLNEKITHMGQRTTREKLMSFLSAQARKNKSSEFDIEFSRQQLADYLSVERSAMSAELGKLKKDGIVDFEKNHFKLIL